MKTTSKLKTSILSLLSITTLALLLLPLAGCKSLTNLSKTKTQTQYSAINAEVLLKALEKDSNNLAEFLSAMPESGAVGWTRRESVVRDKEGNPILKDGVAQTVKQESIGKSNSMRDLADVDSVTLVLGGVAVNKVGDIHADSSLTGLLLFLNGNKLGSKVSPEFAKAFNERVIGEKQATAEGVKQALEAKKGLYMEVINSAGKAVAGVLKEVKDVTPYGAGSALAEVVLKDKGDELTEKIEVPLK